MQIFHYVVRPGDTLTSIAKKFNTTVLAISRMNGIVNPDEILAGQVLRVPNNLPNIGVQQQKYYVVQKGDSLWKIANKFNTTVDRLLQLNRIRNPRLIYPGQVLRVA